MSWGITGIPAHPWLAARDVAFAHICQYRAIDVRTIVMIT